MWDIRQDKRYAKYMDSIGWDVDMIGSVYCYSKRLPLVGFSITKIQRPQVDVPMFEIRNLAKKRKSFSVVVEPSSPEQMQSMIDGGFKVSRSISLPSTTQIIDLKKSKNYLLKEMHSKTRYNIKRFSGGKYVFNFSRDITQFVHLWQKVAYDRGMFISQEREIEDLYTMFKSTSKILFLSIDGEVEAGILLIRSKNMSYYMHAFSTQKGKAAHAPTLLAWKSIEVAKKSGSSFYDFEGVYDTRAPLKAWIGFSRFKKSFGGFSEEYPLPVQKYFLPIFMK